MSKVYLMVGSAMGDSPVYYVADCDKADAILEDGSSMGRWPEACEYVCEHEDVFGEGFDSIVEAMNHIKVLGAVIEEEVDFVIY